MPEENKLTNRIIYSALENFISRGIKKSSIDEIARNSGVTRITVYRYFENKELLVRAVFLHIVNIIEVSGEYIDEDTRFEEILDRMQAGLAALPDGNLLVLMDELKLIYPDIYNEANTRRVAAFSRIFNSYFSNNSNCSELRDELDPEFIQVIIEYLILNIVKNPVFASTNLTQDELFSNIKRVILHGILKEG